MSLLALPSLTRRATLQTTGALFALSCFGSRAAETATDSLRIVCGFPAGSATDTTSRRIAHQLDAQGYTKVATVDNRAGAGGQIATQYVKSQPADGRTLLLTPMSMLGIYPQTYKKLPYDPVDFAPVSMACQFDFGVAVGASVPASVTTVPELLRWCSADPRRGTYGSPAAGAIPHFIGMLLGRAANVGLTHVAYRGTPPMVQDVVGGQIPIGIGPLGDMLRYAGSPGYRVLASSGAKRSPFAPALPTLLEVGFAELGISEWSGFFAPAGTPPLVITRTQKALALAIASTDTETAFAAAGLEAKASTPAELAEALAKDAARWGGIVKSFGFSMDS